MAFKWSEYITFGRSIQNGPEESKFRSSISRGYYGVYHKAKLSIGYNSKDTPKHQEIQDGLQNNESFNSRNALRLSNIYSTLKQDRVKADYKAFENVDFRLTQMFWTNVDRFFQILDEELDQ